MHARIEHKHAFGPRELNKLAQAFEGAWRGLAEEVSECSTEQLEFTRTTLAQAIFACATRGAINVENVGQLREHGLLGLQWSTDLASDLP
jgi:hypothetical protein